MTDDGPHTAATRSSWRLEPCPDLRESLSFGEVYTIAEFERIKAGFIPRDMDDKWFIFFEEPWLYLHRSWTGNCIFAVRFECSSQGAAAVASWVNRNKEQYPSLDIHQDEIILTNLVNSVAGRDSSPAEGRSTTGQSIWQRLRNRLRSASR